MILCPWPLLNKKQLGLILTAPAPYATVRNMSQRKRRLEVHLDAPLLAWLRLQAKRRNVTLASIVREAIRKLMDETK